MSNDSVGDWRREAPVNKYGKAPYILGGERVFLPASVGDRILALEAAWGRAIALRQTVDAYANTKARLLLRLQRAREKLISFRTVDTSNVGLVDEAIAEIESGEPDEAVSVGRENTTATTLLLQARDALKQKDSAKRLAALAAIDAHGEKAGRGNE